MNSSRNRLKDEVLDLEDFNESVALNEFSLDDFRMDLANYVEGNRTKLQDAGSAVKGSADFELITWLVVK